jgi:hypothetical protein
MPDTIIQPSFTVGSLRGPFGNGAITNQSLGPHGEGLVSQLDAPYRMGVRNGETFFAANQATTVTTIALAATYTGIVVYNPVTSKKNLSILKVSFSLWVAPGGIAAIGLLAGWAATGIVTHTTPLSVYGAKTLAAAVPYGGADAAATLVGTPIWLCMLTEANSTGALPTSGSNAIFDIGGVFEVPPGGYLGIGTQTVASGVGSILWREVDP